MVTTALRPNIRFATVLLAVLLAAPFAERASAQTASTAADEAAIVTDGRATLEGDRLILDFRGHLDASGEGDDDDDEEGGPEEGTYHFEGRRR